MGRLPGDARLLGLAGARPRWDAGRTFERFTDEARQVVVAAQAEARDFCHNYIGTEHLLLGILREADTDAAQILGERGVTVDTARAQLRAIVARGEAETSGQIPFTPRAKHALELALRECISHGNQRVTAEHLLLGLLREGEGVAAAILKELDLDLDAIRAEVVDRLPAPGEAPPPPVSRERWRSRGRVHAADAETGFLNIGFTPAARRLLMQAGARALWDGRTEIDVADLEGALRREPPEAAAG